MLENSDEERTDHVANKGKTTPTKPEWMTKVTSMRSLKKDATTAGGTTTTVSGTTATPDSITPRTEYEINPKTPQSIILEASKQGSIESTLGGSVVHDDDDR